IGQTGVNQFSILNIGDGTLSIDTLEFNNELFGSNVTTFPLEIQANSSATIDLNFTPAEFGRENG
ncbi:MAG: hypothetical protein GWN13_26600, partial [Phycisphaerae bacterium]|nr:hypothetical protein [Phycisphaerae bacterium]